MKATYQKPETIISLISTVQMIAASPYGENFKPADEPIDLGDLKGTDATSGNLSRRSIWDEEEEGF